VLPQRSLSARATREDAPHVFMSEQGVAVRHVLRSQRPESTPRALCPGTCFLAFFCFQSGLQECEAPTWSGSLDRLGRPVAASRGGLSARSAARQARGVNSTALESRRFVTPEFPFAFQRWCRELATPHPARNISDQYQQVIQTRREVSLEPAAGDPEDSTNVRNRQVLRGASPRMQSRQVRRQGVVA
jgi:hypothetical protein